VNGTSFVAIYRGPTISAARLIAVSADPSLVAEVCDRLLTSPPPDDPDSITAGIERGRRAALRLIHREASRAPNA
jgi:hypothetical protein